jgi:ABC-type transporter Mla MlaB component
MATKQSKSKREVKPQLAHCQANVVDQVVAVSVECAAERLNETEVSVTNVAVAASAASDMVSLPAICTVRDCAALKVELLPLFDHESVVTIDMRAVERIDTSMLQLLLAFVRDRKEASRVTKWIGDPECINEAVNILGMADVLNMGSDSSGAVA